MPGARRFVRIPLFLLFTILLCACSTVRGSHPQQALPAVSPAPRPQVPSWIESISPTERAETLAQIRVIFRNPLIPLQAIETPDEQTKLTQFVVDPRIPGRFRFLTPRMVGFQQDAALPIATRIRVTLKAGLSDLAGHSLDRDLSWTFTTAPLRLTNLPGEPSADADSPDSPVFDLAPTLRIRSNAELDVESLREHTTLSAEGQNAKLPLLEIGRASC